MKKQRFEQIPGEKVQEWDSVKGEKKKLRDELPNGPWKSVFVVNKGEFYYVGMTPHNPILKAERAEAAEKALAKAGKKPAPEAKKPSKKGKKKS